MLAWFEHGRGKGCVGEEFPHIRKLRKNYRLEAKWGENDIKYFGITAGVTCRKHFKALDFDKALPVE